MGQESLSKEIDRIFENRRIPYEGISEKLAKRDLIALITQSQIELLKRLKQNIEYNENGQNKIINATISNLRNELTDV